MLTRRHLLAVTAAAAALPRPALARELRGAGSSFVAPLMEAWIEGHNLAAPGAAFLQYQSVGSGEGIRRFLAGEVDFAGTERPLTDDEIAGLSDGAVHVPVTAGMLAIAFNLSGYGDELRLSRETLVGIFGGTITRWDDPALVALNPGLADRARDIFRVARRDSSGTTFAFTSFLAAIDPAWRTTGPGIGTVVDWPGHAMTAYGNEGVSARLAVTEDSIGYVQFSFAEALGLSMAVLQNHSDHFVAPSRETGMAALASVARSMPADGRQVISNVFGANAYPIVSYTWAVVPERQSEPDVAQAMHAFLAYALSEAGQATAMELGYTPLPEPVSARALALLDLVG